MKDRVWMAIAFLGFVVLVFVVGKNYNRHDDESVYQVDGSYQPELRDNLTNAKALYEQLQGSRRITCPATTCPTPTGHVVNLTAIYGSYNQHIYQVSCLFIASGAIGDNFKEPRLDYWRTDLQLNGTTINEKGSIMLNDLFVPDLFSDERQYIEIISPFAFSFDNINSGSVTYSDKDDKVGKQSIVIVNSDKTCRITFDDVANWFCAGEVGTVSIGGTGDDKSIDWSEHYK